MSRTMDPAVGGMRVPPASSGEEVPSRPYRINDETLRAVVDAESHASVLLACWPDAERPAEFVVTHANRAAMALWGMSGAEIGVRRIGVATPASLTGYLNAVCTQVWLTGEAVDGGELHWPGHAGLPDRYFEFRVRRLGDRLHLTCPDVSERREERERVRAEAARFQVVAENVSDIVFRTDPDGVLTWVSSSVRTVLGREPDQLQGLRAADMMHPDDACASEVGQGQGTSFEGRFRHLNGSWVWMAVTTRAHLDADGRFTGCVGSGRDISRRVSAEQGLADSERRLRSEHEALREILDASLDPLVVFREVRDDTGVIQDLEYIHCNHAAEQNLGRSREVLMGQHLSAVFLGDSARRILAWARPVIDSGEELLLTDQPLTSEVARDGRLFDISIVKVLDGVAMTWRDVSAGHAAAAALAASEEQFRLAMESSAVALCLVSPEGQFLTVNPALSELLGRDAHTLEQSTWQAVTHPEDVDADAALVDSVLRGERDSYRLTKRYLRPDGAVVHGLLSVVGVRGDDGEVAYFVSQIVDVTELLQSRQALARSEEHYRLLAENTADIVAKVGEAGVLEWISPSVTHLLGWLPEEIVGEPISSFIWTNDWNRVADVLRANRHAGMDADGVFRVRRRNGAWIWVNATASSVEDAAGHTVRVARIRDVDAETRARIQLERSEERFRAAMQSTPVGMALVTRSGRFLQVNEALCRMVQRTEESLVGGTITSLTHPGDHDVDLEMWNVLHGTRRTSVTREKRLLDGHGQVVWVQQALAAVLDDEGNRTSFVAQFMDITEAREARALLDFQANHDPLTDLKNRRGVLQAMTAVLAHPPRTGTNLGVLYCDLDGFKQINDEHGHAVGDEILIEVGRRIRRCVRNGDTVGRLGGDEFVVLLTQIHDVADAIRVGEHIRAEVARPVRCGSGEVTPTLSVGVALARSGDDTDAVLARADRALYKAKESGRNRTVGEPD